MEKSWFMPPYFEVPGLAVFLIVMAPFFWFQIHDFRAFKTSPDYALERSKFISYFTYRALAPRNPSKWLYLFWVFWAMFIVTIFDAN